MVTQYSSKLVIVLLNLQHALRLRILGLKAKKPSSSAQRIQRLSALASNARTLFRIWGILPILQWVSPCPSRKESLRVLI